MKDIDQALLAEVRAFLDTTMREVEKAPYTIITATERERGELRFAGLYLIAVARGAWSSWEQYAQVDLRTVIGINGLQMVVCTTFDEPVPDLFRERLETFCSARLEGKVLFTKAA